MKKSVLVVGGSYFIGKKIVDVLVEHNYTVFTLNRGTTPHHNPAIKQLIYDRNHPKHLDLLLKDYLFDFVVDVSSLNDNHVKTLHNALNQTNLKKYIFISSSAVYDIENLSPSFKETDTRKQNKYWTDYGQNKIQAEAYLQNAYNNKSTQLICLRPPYVYGENNYVQRESFVFQHLLNSKPILVPNHGETGLQFIYATDLARIVATLLEKTVSEPIFNVGNKKTIRMIDWIKTCETVVHNHHHEVKASIVPFDYGAYGYSERDFFPFYDYENVLDVTKINQYYDEETPIEYGLEQAFLWYRKYADEIIMKEYVTNKEHEILSALQNT